MSLIIFISSIILMILALLYKPKIRIFKIELETYWLVILFAAFLTVASGIIGLQDLSAALFSDREMNPVKLVILFIMMTVLSVFLDEIGFFKWLALRLLEKVRGSQLSFFLALYFLVSLLTVFTSNDVIILTFTPLIIYFAKNAKIDPLPHLFGILVAANTWSITLIVGNPTNIYLAVNGNISFLDYLKVMWLPGIIAGLSGLLMVYLTFRKKLDEPIELSVEDYRLPYPFLAVTGVVIILLTIFLLAVSNFIGLPMWLIVLAMAIVLLLISFVYLFVTKGNLKIIGNTIKKAPWTFIPFILGMFVLVESLKTSDYLSAITGVLSYGDPVFSFGFSSFFASNFMNNQPMSMLYSLILELVPAQSRKLATYASIIGSNIGVLLTPVGALAGLMWMNLLHSQNIKLSFLSYVKNIFLIGLVVLVLSLSGLLLVNLLMPVV